MPIPPLEFLLDASTRSLEDAELNALNRAANLRKAIRVEVEALGEEMAEAMVARWMIENRDTLLKKAALTVSPHKVEFIPDIKKRA